jgi:hypothetical protein
MGAFGSHRIRLFLKGTKKESGAGLLRSMCRDLGIEPRDL